MTSNESQYNWKEALGGQVDTTEKEIIENEVVGRWLRNNDLELFDAIMIRIAYHSEVIDE